MLHFVAFKSIRVKWSVYDSQFSYLNRYAEWIAVINIHYLLQTPSDENHRIFRPLILKAAQSCKQLKTYFFGTFLAHPVFRCVWFMPSFKVAGVRNKLSASYSVRFQFLVTPIVNSTVKIERKNPR